MPPRTPRCCFPYRGSSRFANGPDRTDPAMMRSPRCSNRPASMYREHFLLYAWDVLHDWSRAMEYSRARAASTSRNAAECPTSYLRALRRTEQCDLPGVCNLSCLQVPWRRPSTQGMCGDACRQESRPADCCAAQGSLYRRAIRVCFSRWISWWSLCFRGAWMLSRGHRWHPEQETGGRKFRSFFTRAANSN